MNVKKTRVGLLTVVLTVALMFSLFTVSAFATETTPPASATPAESTPVESTPVESTPVESTPVESTPVESTPAESTPAESTPGASASASAAPESSNTPSSDTENGQDAGKKMSTDTLISIIVGGVILVVIAVVCVIKREALGKFMRGLKSEMKKIVWLPKNQTLKNTAIVLIIVAICTIVIALLDAAFGMGINLLDKIK